jgi:electron transfer flavoprotein alpha subunit
MSVLVFAETSEGKFKKSAFEVTSYGRKVAEKMGCKLIVLSINASNTSELYKYGAEKVLSVNNEQLNTFNAKIVANIIQQAAKKEQTQVVILEASSNSLYIAPIIAVNLNAGYASNVVELPSSIEPFILKRKGFSNKAFNITQLNSAIKVIGLSKNSFGIVETEVSGTTEEFTPSLIENNLILEKIEKTSGKVTIADADIVVSGGRGLKGPENWGMIEELAGILGAATACSKPVSDLGWRPHSEHVGQTGKPVASNLYIAIGISGAIQHIAGINSSKVKVVINTDPEAPFFKAADYGIVGDAFEVVPQLIEKLKIFKANNT